LIVHVGADEDDEGGPEHATITCGSAIKIQHVTTGYRIHSHEIKWGSGSHQQSVTAMNAMDDPNSLWVVKGAHGSHCHQGTSVKNGQAVRFMHLKTGRNLHTHHFESPLTKQMEVSAYGNDGEGDHLDDWVVETADSPDWRRGSRVRFKNRGTGAYLHSHTYRFDKSNCGGNCPIMGQQEVTAFQVAGDDNNWWRSAEGVYFPAVQ